MHKTVEKLLNDLMANTHVRLMLPQEVTGPRWYHTTTGVRQGDNTGPRIFKREMLKVLTNWKRALDEDDSYTKMHVEYCGETIDISHSAYVDDTWRMNLSWTGENLLLQTQTCKAEFANALKKQDLSIHPTKGQCLIQFGGRGLGEKTRKWIPQWDTGEPVESMRVLGSQVSVARTNKEEITLRLGKFHYSCSTFRRFLLNNRVSRRWRALVFKAVCIKTLTYGLETREIGTLEMQRMERAVMKWARKMLGRDGYGKLSEDHKAVAGKSDAWVREQLDLMTIQDMLSIARLKWFRKMIMKETAQGVGSVPLLAALLGTTILPPGIRERYPSAVVLKPLDNGGNLTNDAPPLLRALDADMIRIGVGDISGAWRENLVKHGPEAITTFLSDNYTKKKKRDRSKEPIILEKALENNHTLLPPGQRLSKKQARDLLTAAPPPRQT